MFVTTSVVVDHIDQRCEWEGAGYLWLSQQLLDNLILCRLYSGADKTPENTVTNLTTQIIFYTIQHEIGDKLVKII